MDLFGIGHVAAQAFGEIESHGPLSRLASLASPLPGGERGSERVALLAALQGLAATHCPCWSTRRCSRTAAHEIPEFGEIRLALHPEYLRRAGRHRALRSGRG